jgi:hypothetical protein
LKTIGVEPNPCNAILRLKLHLFEVRSNHSKFLAVSARIRVISYPRYDAGRAPNRLSGYYGCGNPGEKTLGANS